MADTLPVTDTPLPTPSEAASEPLRGKNGWLLGGACLQAALGNHPRGNLGKKHPVPWKKGEEWGPVGHGWSRLGRLATRIEIELLAMFEQPLTPVQCRLIRATAETGAYAEKAAREAVANQQMPPEELLDAFITQCERLVTVSGMKQKAEPEPAQLPRYLQRAARRRETLAAFRRARVARQRRPVQPPPNTKSTTPEPPVQPPVTPARPARPDNDAMWTIHGS